jgi:signal transduction histidine kinase
VIEHDPKEILHQVFPGLSEEDLAELSTVATLKTYPPGTILCHEGRVEDTFYIVVAGRTEVCKHVEESVFRVLHRPGPGEFFGEIALVQDSARTADVRTLEPTVVLEIGRKAFTSVLQRSASMAVRIMLQVTSRLRDGDQRAITELRQKNIELAQAYDELAAEQRLRSEFLTTVAHELRTPLAAATGYLQLVRSGAIMSEQTPVFLETVANNLDTVVHLVNNILFLQELELITPEFAPLHIDQVVRQALEEIQEQATNADLTINTQIEDGLPQMSGNAGGMSRAISALLDNAVKFSPEGGAIDVRVHVQDRLLHIVISDQGVGFPMERVNDVYKPFVRIEETAGHLFGGVGLGLPIAKQVVESHGGRIEIKSEVGSGSTFTIVLPTIEGAGA